MTVAINPGLSLMFCATAYGQTVRTLYHRDFRRIVDTFLRLLCIFECFSIDIRIRPTQAPVILVC